MLTRVNSGTAKPESSSAGIIRLLSGIALLAMCGLPVASFISAKADLSDLIGLVRELEKFFGNQAAAWMLAGFLICVPLFGLYLIIVPRAK